ncbi:hypothetical protein B0H19DRAFT_1079544 [Mycena capillaripes]|nr:hypothetical protein B0H19DRAFT_1079544 [Mycena capillaripes]
MGASTPGTFTCFFSNSGDSALSVPYLRIPTLSSLYFSLVYREPLDRLSRILPSSNPLILLFSRHGVNILIGCSYSGQTICHTYKSALGALSVRISAGFPQAPILRQHLIEVVIFGYNPDLSHGGFSAPNSTQFNLAGELKIGRLQDPLLKIVGIPLLSIHKAS